MVRLLHASLKARDGDALAGFYKDVFGFLDRRPPRRLFGDIVGRGNGLPGADIYSVWLNPPDNDGPFLEIMEYSLSGVARAACGQRDRAWPSCLCGQGCASHHRRGDACRWEHAG